MPKVFRWLLSRASIFAWGAFVVAVAAHGAEGVRVAVVAEENGLRIAADLLTARLSTNPGVVLVERAELAKVYQEQGLSPNNWDYFKLGHLLQADGVLVLHLANETDAPRMTVRLVAVKSGVTLGESEFPWPMTDFMAWAGLEAGELSPWLPKLAVPPGEAVPISILNLRSAVASPDGEALERQLTSLLYDRLSREKEIFVLERRRLEWLTEEKDDSEAPTNSFWNGSYLVEGVLDPKGFNADTVAASVRLSPPDKSATVTIEVTGTRTNLAGMIEGLTGRILGAVKKKSTGEAWSPQAEAERYLTEARWMLRWKMNRKAAAAAESAWGLGRQSAELAQLRVQAWAEAAGDPGVCLIQSQSAQVTFGENAHPGIFNPSLISAFASAPKPERFAALVRSMELYDSAFQNYVRPQAKLDPAWLGIGTNLLNRASWWLRYYYFEVAAREGELDKIGETRRLCLEIADDLSGHPGFAKAVTNHSLLNIKARHAAFWVETPEHALALYRGMLENGDWPLVRRRFFDGEPFELRDLTMSASEAEAVTDAAGGLTGLASVPAGQAHPTLAGWNWAARARGPALWQGFIDEMCRSTKPEVNLEGQILRCSYAWSLADFRERLAPLLQEVLHRKDALNAAGQAPQLLADLEALVNEHVNDAANVAHDAKSMQIWADFWRDFTGEQLAVRAEVARPSTPPGEAPRAGIPPQGSPRVLFPPAGRPGERTAKLEERKKYLATQTAFDFNALARLFPAGDITPEEAKELSPLFADYEARVEASDSGGGNPFRGRLLATVKERLDLAKAGPPTAPANASNLPQSPMMANGMPPGGPPARPGFPPMRGLPPNFAERFGRGGMPEPASAPSDEPDTTNALEVRQFWKIPAHPAAAPTVNYTQMPASPEIKSACFREGKLWVEVQESQLGDQVSLYGLDLATFAAERIPYQGDFLGGVTVARQKSRPPFDVDRGHVYLTLGNAITAWSFAEKSWSQLALPTEGGVLPWCLGGRLFFTTPSSILERTPDGTIRTLASSRRRPAQGPLDELNTYDALHLFMGANGVLHATTGHNVYEWATGSDGWIQLAGAPNLNWGGYHPFDNGFIVPRTAPSRSGWGMLGNSAAPELLFEKTLGRPGNLGATPGAESPRWVTMPPGDEICLDQDSVWCLVNPIVNLTNSAMASLYHFKTGDPRPVILPLRFGDANQGSESAAPLGAGRMTFLRPLQTIISAPQGLAVIRAGERGLWFIPKPKLEPALVEAAAERAAGDKAAVGKP